MKQQEGIDFDNIIVPDATTFQLEFKYISRLASEEFYISKGLSIYQTFGDVKGRGIFPIEIKNSKHLQGELLYNHFYDYELKTWLLCNNQNNVYILIDFFIYLLFNSL